MGYRHFLEIQNLVFEIYSQTEMFVKGKFCPDGSTKERVTKIIKNYLMGSRNIHIKFHRITGTIY